MRGDRQPMIPLAQSEIVRDVLKGAGIEVRLQVIRGAGRGFEGPESTDTVARSFDETLWTKPRTGMPSVKSSFNGASVRIPPRPSPVRRA